MAAAERPKLIGITIESWRLGIEAVRRMPVVIGAGLILMIAFNAATMPLLPSYDDEMTAGTQLFELATWIAQAFLLTPVAIAVHRFVLLGDVTARYAPNPFQPRVLRFFIWSAILHLIVSLPVWPAVIMGPSEEIDAAFFAMIALLIVALFIALRLFLLFPAIAVDARGAHWRNAWTDSSGHMTFVVGTVIVSAIPFLIGGIVAYVQLGWPAPDNLVAGTTFSAIYSAAYVFSVCVYSALASKFYAAFANTLKG